MGLRFHEGTLFAETHLLKKTTVERQCSREKEAQVREEENFGGMGRARPFVDLAIQVQL
jgi:hypothetical protein